jgi:hypothetical protein
MQRRHAAVILLVTILAVGACSGGGAATPTPTAVDPATAMADSLEAVYEAGSFHMDFEMVFDIAGTSLRMDGDADIDVASGRQRMSMTFGDLPILPPDTSMEFIVDGATMYMRSDLFVPTVPEGNWLAIDLDDPPPGFEELTDLGTGQNDPSAYFDYARGIEGAQTVGPETIGGLEVTHYRGTVNLQAAYENAPPDVAERLRRTTEALEVFDDLEMVMDLWVGADGLPVRQGVTMSAAVPGAGTMTADITADISGIGDPVELQLPSADQVVDAEDLV